VHIIRLLRAFNTIPGSYVTLICGLSVNIILKIDVKISLMCCGSLLARVFGYMNGASVSTNSLSKIKNYIEIEISGTPVYTDTSAYSKSIILKFRCLAHLYLFLPTACLKLRSILKFKYMVLLFLFICQLIQNQSYSNLSIWRICICFYQQLIWNKELH
jgi:hypothetical protein